MLGVLICFYVIYAFLFFIISFTFTCEIKDDLYDEVLEKSFIVEYPYYFSPKSLIDRTNLNTIGILLMVVIHFIINPIYCIFMTIGYTLGSMEKIIYLITHKK